MKTLIPLILIAISFNSISAPSFVDRMLDGEKYILVGVGYKFKEVEVRYCREDYSRPLADGSYWRNCYYGNNPFSARFELGIDYGNIRVGLSHDSQWATGEPFNDRGEYSKSEFFIDYVYKWK